LFNEILFYVERLKKEEKMEITKESLRQYSTMDTEELVKLYKDEALFLTKAASAVIEEILIERGVTIEKRGKIIIERLEKKRKQPVKGYLASQKDSTNCSSWPYWLLAVLALGLMRIATDDRLQGAKEVVGKMGKVIDQVLTPHSVYKKETEINPYQAYLKYLELQRNERDLTSGEKNKTEKKADVDPVAWNSGYCQAIHAYHSNRGERPSDIFLEDIARKSMLESLHTGKSNIRDPREYVNDFKEGFDEGWDQCSSAMQEE
jgi:hypothetical protein